MPITPPQQNWALFLDLDGTLLDIAERPDAVVVPEGLVAVLAALRDFLGGALAVVSGRPMADLDRLLRPLACDCGAEHGAVLRYRGANAVLGEGVPPVWVARIRVAAQDWPGVLVEEKTRGVAVHYRQAPQYARAIEQLLRSLVTADRRFQILCAHMAFELRDAEVHKGRAVAEFMAREPYCGRLPVFVGDDVTDEDGIREAVLQGGLGLRVAEAFAGETAKVRAWLAGLA